MGLGWFSGPEYAKPYTDARSAEAGERDRDRISRRISTARAPTRRGRSTIF